MPKKNSILALGHTYSLGVFEYTPGEILHEYVGIKGAENYEHTTTNEFGIMTQYNGRGGGRDIQLSKLTTNVHYRKNGAIDENNSEHMGEFAIDLMGFIKRNITRKNGDPIKRFSDALLASLNTVSGYAHTSSFPFVPGVLPPDAYLSLLKHIAKMTDLKMYRDNTAELGKGECVKISGEKGVVSFNGVEYSMPVRNLNKAREGQKGYVIYYDDRQGNYGFAFEPY